MADCEKLERKFRSVLAVVAELTKGIACVLAAVEAQQTVIDRLCDPEEQTRMHLAVDNAKAEIEELKKLWTLETKNG